MTGITAVKVFSTTMARDREHLGQRIADWLQAHPELTVVDRVTTQTSDNEFHCLSMTLFLSGDATRYAEEAARVPAPRAR